MTSELTLLGHLLYIQLLLYNWEKSDGSLVLLYNIGYYAYELKIVENISNQIKSNQGLKKKQAKNT